MQLPDQILARLQRLACLHPLARVQFRLPDASDFYVYLTQQADGGEVVSQFGHAENPALILEMANSTLSAILDGRLSARHAFLLGDILYSGDRDLAAALADLFPAEC
ncbi:SCP-2 sterol transfer family protein [Microbulbifer donghaiensis]|uniref:SCP-2 sterol transfer family protein n=1 Tax=Microbulbifer donghaiensis TaxID=494016 RepID=A0A1M5GKG4_9GAMM|nr:SCP2 sterol-binding domain-containing protein [Microbulbifer donghaiensis]SHG04240.1 SCP-2 sterol transfer family protein [Microbulbifer donghaiensis]